MSKLVIGLSGKKRAGKDTAARYFIEASNYQVVSVSFAAELKLEICVAFGCDYMYIEGAKRSKDPVVRECARQLMQSWGAKRRAQDPRYFVRKLGPEANIAYPLVITDVRHIEEVEYIRSFPNNLLIRINRTPVDDDHHESETALDHYNNWDIVISNTDSINEYREALRKVYAKHIAHRLLDKETL